MLWRLQLQADDKAFVARMPVLFRRTKTNAEGLGKAAPYSTDTPMHSGRKERLGHLPWRDRDLYSRVVYQWRTEGLRLDVCDEKGLNLDIQKGLSNSFCIFYLLPPTRFYSYCTPYTACRS